MSENNKLSGVTAIQNVFYSEIGIGIMTNTLLLLSHILIFLLHSRPRPTDLAVSHLALIHIMMLTSVGLVVAGIFGTSHFRNDHTCQSVPYLNRLMRALSIGTTCLLSVLQAITLSPRSSCLAKFKQNSTRHSLRCLLFLWIFNLSINTQFLLSTVANFNGTLDRLLFVKEYCSLWPQNPFLSHVFITLRTLQDVTFIGLMVLSSGYMVTLLCRHRRSSRHLHSTKLFVKAPPEQRAIQTILLLLSFFVLVYFTDCIVNSLRTVWTLDPVCFYVQILLSNGFAAVSPLVFICTEKRICIFTKEVIV